MAGHSHWAGIKHRKGRADKQRSKIFSKFSREITVAAKLGDKDPLMNPSNTSVAVTGSNPIYLLLLYILFQHLLSFQQYVNLAS